MNTPFTIMVKFTFLSDLNRLLLRRPRRKNLKRQKIKRSYAIVAAANATRCSARTRPRKEKKNWREVVQYLRSVDRPRFLRRERSVLVCSVAALRHEMER